MKKLDSKTLQYIAHAYGKKFDDGGNVPSKDSLLQDISGENPNAPETNASYQPDAAANTPSDAPPAGFDGSPQANPNVPISSQTLASADMKSSDDLNAAADPNAQATPSEEAPSQAAPVQGPSSPQNLPTLSPYAKAFEDQKEAKTAEAKAIGAEGAAEKQAIDQGLKDVNALPTSQDVLNNYKAKDDALFKAYQDKKLDPNRYYNNLNTAQKVTSGLALILGGIGSGLTHQPNLAAKMIDDNINRDIDAQKNDQNQTMNLWKMNKEEYGDDQAANVATKNQILTGVKYQLQSAASAAKGPIAQAQAQGANALIDQEMARNNMILGLHANLTGQTQESQTEQGFLQAKNAADVMAPAMAKSAEEKYLPSIGLAKIPPTPADKEAVLSLTDLNQKIDIAENLQKQFGLTGAWTPTSRAQAREVQDQLNVSLNQLFNLKRLTPVEYDNFKNQIGRIGGVNIGGTLEGLKALKDDAAQKKATLFNQLGVTPFKNPIAPNQAPVTSGKPSTVIQNGHSYSLNPQTGQYE